jgi:hypothetical protein
MHILYNYIIIIQNEALEEQIIRLRHIYILYKYMYKYIYIIEHNRA